MIIKKSYHSLSELDEDIIKFSRLDFKYNTPYTVSKGFLFPITVYISIELGSISFEKLPPPWAQVRMRLPLLPGSEINFDLVKQKVNERWSLYIKSVLGDNIVSVGDELAVYGGKFIMQPVVFSIDPHGRPIDRDAEGHITTLSSNLQPGTTPLYFISKEPKLTKLLAHDYKTQL